MHNLGKTEQWCKSRYSFDVTRTRCSETAAKGTPDWRGQLSLKLAYTPLPPFCYKEASSLLGIDIDLWRIVVDKLQTKTEFIPARNVGHIPTMVRQCTQLSNNTNFRL